MARIFRLRKEISAYDASNFLAELGGISGLFLGLSILGVFEGFINCWAERKLITP